MKYQEEQKQEDSRILSSDANNMDSMSSFKLVKLQALDSETFETEECKTLQNPADANSSMKTKQAGNIQEMLIPQFLQQNSNDLSKI